ncbi:MAG: hypothetical protein RI907_1390 [Pseudomonadota bacterium]|jgi:tetratricopeptide (TPR) repeat protein
MRAELKLTLLAAACLLSACGSWERDRTPGTLATLRYEQLAVEPDQLGGTSEVQAIRAYQRFLDVAPQSPQSAEARRRLADLEMGRADKASADSPDAGAPDYAEAKRRYQDHLAAHPQDPHRDQVLYQLARAQEQTGELEAALATLTTLVTQHPSTPYADEAQFRRGELLFTTGRYPQAEQAYSAVLAVSHPTPFRDRAMYMQGWSRFKQGQLDVALQSFLGVLDVKLGKDPGRGNLSEVEDLSRADRELLEDTFRVSSLCLSSLQGAEGIAPLVNSPLRQTYAFHIHEQLAEFYLKQDRPKDAADALSLYTRLSPDNGQAARLDARVIDIDERAGFGTLALAAKRQFVERYGEHGPYHEANPTAWERAQPTVLKHLVELTRHHHALAQQSKRAADVNEAVRLYRLLLNDFPEDTRSGHHHFLLAELLYENGRYAEALVDYEQAAYAYVWHAESADAGYAALLTHGQLVQRAPAPERPALQKAAVDSALHFAQTFPKDPRVGPVLSDAADKLFALNDGERAAKVARQVLDLQPPAGEPQRRVAWTVIAHTAFERSDFAGSEQACAQALKLMPEGSAGRRDLVERQAAAIYKQGEQAREAGRLDEALLHFTRVDAIAPQSGVIAHAQFDAAAVQVAMKDWAAAAAALEAFSKRHPKHPLQVEAQRQLAGAYTEQGNWAGAAAALERFAGASTDATLARDALWQAAEMREKAGQRPAATQAYEKHLAQSLALRPVPLLPVVEARARLARLAHEEGNLKRELALMKDIQQADLQGGNARTDRTRYLGAMATLALAEPVAEAYRKVALIEPLQKQLKLKKARMEDALKAYAQATDYGVADVSTAATYHVASIYRDFGKAMMASQRPKKMSALELEQYNVLLEEQAFPFEEKASELHEVNARRAAQGVYDQWVQQSFDALGELLPVRYGKRERGEALDVLSTPATQLPASAAALEQAAQQAPKQPARYNALGVAYRRLGQFDKARAAYEQAMALDATYAPAVLNLGILSDLYQGDVSRAQSLYERYLTLTPAGDATVTKWVAEIKKRKPATAAPAATPPKEAS